MIEYIKSRWGMIFVAAAIIGWSGLLVVRSTLKPEIYLFDGYAFFVNFGVFLIISLLAFSTLFVGRKDIAINIILVAFFSVVGLFTLEFGLHILRYSARPTTVTEQFDILDTQLGHSVERLTTVDAIARARKTNPAAMRYASPYNWYPQANSDGGFEIGGEILLPINGVANREVVFCREGGYWINFEADHLGFRNSEQDYLVTDLDIAMVGDSFTIGSCVPDGQETAGKLRGFGLSVLNFGQYGDGPLLQLATLKEYVVPHRPQTALWMYYDGNDFPSDLNWEKQNSILRRYVETPSFSQNLLQKQDTIQQFLLKFSEDGYLQAKEAQESTTPLKESFINEFNFREMLALGLLRYQLGATNPTGTPDFTLLKRVFDEAVATARQHGIRLVFVYQPGWQTVFEAQPSYHQRNNDLALNLARESGFEILDLRPVLRQADNRDSLFRFQGSHYSVEGYSLVAKTIETWLQQ
ncbi:hypothetical protein [Thalassospira sp.]|uniref:hypothetical protein n=2 Tax=Thalassospira sp. TaxID=1912094 RepID=UPI0032EEDB8D